MYTDLCMTHAMCLQCMCMCVHVLFFYIVCRMVVHRMCMVEGIPSCDVWQKRKAGEESESLQINKQTIFNFILLFYFQCLHLGWT